MAFSRLQSSPAGSTERQLQKPTKSSAARWSFSQIQDTVRLMCMHSKFMNETRYCSLIAKDCRDLFWERFDVIMVSWEKKIGQIKSDPY